MSAAERYDVAVIGAGIVGLATARALLARRPGLGLVVLEAEDRPGAHQTGHNSGVLHSGLYYAPGTLKAELCARGRAAMTAYCREKGVPFERCGKVVVATDEAELPRLEQLEERGRANGLEQVERLGPEGIREREPRATGVAGLFIGDTGIVDFGAVVRALVEDVEAAGGAVRLGHGAGAFRREPAGGFTIETAAGEVGARRVVNCGGLQADRVARRAGTRPRTAIVPFRGEYRVLAPDLAGQIRGLIYPVPDPRFPFLGVHLTRRMDGSVEAGPNAVLALARHGYRRGAFHPRDAWELATNPGLWRMGARYWRTALAEEWRSLSRRAFARALARLVPGLRASDLLPGGSGVRAQALNRDGTLADDFCIEAGPDALHVLSAPSPAATASLAIGEHLADRAEGLLDGA